MGRAATIQEQQSILAVGRPAVEAKYRLTTWANCKNGDTCFFVGNPLSAIVGTNAAVFSGSTGLYPQGSLGSACVVYLSRDTAGWHYINSACAQNPGFWPGRGDHVFVGSGCANVRAAAGLTSQVIACLAANTEVSVDSAPVFADGHIWWHLARRGWMAHDFLVAPNL